MVISATELPTDLPQEHYTAARENEEGLLGECILRPEFIDEVSSIVAGRDFYNADHGSLFDALVEMHNAGLAVGNPRVLRQQLHRSGFGGTDGIAFVESVTRRAAGQFAQAKYFAIQIRKLANVRRLRVILGESVLDCALPGADDEDIKSRVTSQLDAIQFSDGDDVKSVGQLIDDAIAGVAASRARGETLGVATGMPTIDTHTGGFFPGELTVLAARPSIGKTAFALDVLLRMAKRGKRVFLVSLEMGGDQLAHRLLAHETGVSARKIQVGDLNSNENRRIETARHELRDLQLQAFCPKKGSASVQMIRARAKVHASQSGLDLLVIDYLGLIQSASRGKLYERITDLSREVKCLALDLNKPVMVLAQLNRDAAKGEPTLEHLRDSGAIEQDADNVWLLHRESRESLEAKLLVAKQRQGAVGAIDLLFQPETMRFTEPGNQWQPG